MTLVSWGEKPYAPHTSIHSVSAASDVLSFAAMPSRKNVDALQEVLTEMGCAFLPCGLGIRSATANARSGS